LGRLCTEIGLGGGNINSVVHDRALLINDSKSVRVAVEVEVNDTVVGKNLVQRLEESGFVVRIS
jgi:ACT domain-containing protein